MSDYADRAADRITSDWVEGKSMADIANMIREEAAKNTPSTLTNEQILNNLAKILSEEDPDAARELTAEESAFVEKAMALVKRHLGMPPTLQEAYVKASKDVLEQTENYDGDKVHLGAWYVACAILPILAAEKEKMVKELGVARELVFDLMSFDEDEAHKRDKALAALDKMIGELRG